MILFDTMQVLVEIDVKMADGLEMHRKGFGKKKDVVGMHKRVQRRNYDLGDEVEKVNFVVRDDVEMVLNWDELGIVGRSMDGKSKLYEKGTLNEKDNLDVPDENELGV